MEHSLQEQSRREKKATGKRYFATILLMLGGASLVLTFFFLAKPPSSQEKIAALKSDSTALVAFTDSIKAEIHSQMADSSFAAVPVNQTALLVDSLMIVDSIARHKAADSTGHVTHEKPLVHYYLKHTDYNSARLLDTLSKAGFNVRIDSTNAKSQISCNAIAYGSQVGEEYVKALALLMNHYGVSIQRLDRFQDDRGRSNSIEVYYSPLALREKPLSHEDILQK